MFICHVQAAVKQETSEASGKDLLPKDAAYVGVGALLIGLIFYTFHCIWVRHHVPTPFP